MSFYAFAEILLWLYVFLLHVGTSLDDFYPALRDGVRVWYDC